MAGQYAARLGVMLGLDMADFSKGIDKAVAETKKFNQTVERESKVATKEIQALRYAVEDYGKEVSYVTKMQREFAEGGKYATLALAYGHQGLKEKLLAEAAAMDAVAAASKRANNIAFEGLSKQQKIGVGYQLTDIVTGLAGGQNPMLVLIQQGGQLKDLFGGIGPMFKGLSQVFTVTRLAIGGLASAFLGLGYVLYKGKDDLDTFNNSLVLTGNLAAMNYDKFKQFTNELNQSTKIGISGSKDIFNALIGSGQFTSASMKSAAEAIALVSKASGESAKDVAQKLIPSLNGTAAGAKSLNDQYNFLTYAQYKNIEALEFQGKKQEAIEKTSKALKDSYKDQNIEVGYLTQSYIKLKDVLDNIKSWGVPESDIDKLKRFQDTLNKFKKEAESLFAPKLFKESAIQNIKNYELMIEELNKKIKADADAVDAEAEKKAKEKVKIENYIAANGLKGQLHLNDEYEKIKNENAYQRRIEGLNQFERLEVESSKKIIDAYNAMQQQNRDTRGVGSTQRFKNYIETIKGIGYWEQQERQKISDQEFKTVNDRQIADKNQIDSAIEKNKLYAENVYLTDKELNIKLMAIKAEQNIDKINKDRLLTETQRMQLIKNEQDNLAKNLELANIKLDPNEIKKVREKIFADKDALSVEQDKLRIYQDNLMISEKDYKIAVSRLETQKEIARISRDESLGSTRATMISEIEANQKRREEIINLGEELTKLRDINQTVFKDMEDAIVTFVKTGKFSFNDLAKSMITNIMAIYAKAQFLQMFNTGKGLLANFFSGGSIGADQARTGSNAVFYAEGGGLQGFANGGEINGPAIVGENGPELFIPKGAGTIIPNNQMAGAMGGPQITYNGPYIANMQAIDTQSATQFLARNKLSVYAANQSASRSLPTSR